MEVKCKNSGAIIHGIEHVPDVHEERGASPT